ncbi:MAG: hypothetical protein JST36_08845 [Bacteroidetes bacterium]|nr:hypothetical protein [Bacteroidota bacterium]
MKKLLTLAMLFCYLTATSGVTLDYFYCCGELSGVSVALADDHGSDDNCSKKSDCCKHQKVFKKISIDQRYAEQAPLMLSAVLHLSTPVQAFSNTAPTFFGKTIDKAFFYDRPPPDCFPTRQVSYCVFRV